MYLFTISREWTLSSRAVPIFFKFFVFIFHSFYPINFNKLMCVFNVRSKGYFLHWSAAFITNASLWTRNEGHQKRVRNANTFIMFYSIVNLFIDRLPTLNSFWSCNWNFLSVWKNINLGYRSRPFLNLLSN